MYVGVGEEMIDTGVVLLIIAAVLLVAVMAAKSAGYKFKHYNESVSVLVTVVIVAGAVSVFGFTQYIAFASVIGAMILVTSSFADYPKMITDGAMILTVAGAVGTLLIFIL